jgi:GTP-binding protein LepA
LTSLIISASRLRKATGDPAEHSRQLGCTQVIRRGHVDFSYEVSRSLAACEGAILVVDAAQGIEAQTMANVHMAIETGLELVAVINKIDLPNANPDLVKHDLGHMVGLLEEEIIYASAKDGTGVPEVLEAIVAQIPPPQGDPDAPLRALIFDSHYDQYKGVIAYVKVVDGRLGTDDTIRLMQNGKETEILELGVFRPAMLARDGLRAGEVGYIATGLKTVGECEVGDTITLAKRPATKPLPGYRPATPMVFAGLYPVDGEEYPQLRDALGRLKLNDASLVFEPESSDALGFGFRCGFLGLLHLEIVIERLDREFDIPLVTTAPSVRYRVTLDQVIEPSMAPRARGDDTGEPKVVEVANPQDLPEPNKIAFIAEPTVRVMLLTPTEYVGPVMQLCEGRRGDMEAMDYLTENRVELRYQLPLASIITDFFDQLKSITRGYASLDYEMSGYQEADLVRVDLLLNGEPVDAFSSITHRDEAYTFGKAMVEKLKELIPRQMFDVPVQAAIGSKIIARETIKAKRKDVLAKCYGGDVSRKRKLLEKQKEGKKKMKSVGSVEVPQEAFVSALRSGSPRPS